MKKTLLAVAVAAALPAAAFAQSNVTMYGVIDLGITKATGSDAQMGANGTGNNGNSRLGVRGSEDLGSGLTATFNFEQGINAETGATDSNTWQRAAWMGLSGAFGTIEMGRKLTPAFYGVAAYELTGTANYTALGNLFGWAGAGSRNNSMFSYKTPNLGGFTVTVGYLTEGDNGGASKIDANAIYRAGALVVGASYNKVDIAGTDAGWALGGAYNFGMFKIAASYQDPADAREGYTLGFGAKLGPVDLVVDAARDTGSALKSTDYVVEAKYALSKRTFAYLAAHRDGSAKITTTGLGVRHNF